MKIYDREDRYGIVALTLGIIGLILWVVPMLSILTNIVCMFYAINGLETKYRDLAVSGLILGFFGFAFTFIRSGLVYSLT